MKLTNLTIVTVIFVLLLVFLLNPFGLWMPAELEYLMVAAVAVVAALFAGLIMGEKARDEREEQIRATSARAGYLAGIFILTLSIAVTVLQGGHVNEWIVGTLAAMVLVRMFMKTRGDAPTQE